MRDLALLSESDVRNLRAESPSSATIRTTPAWADEILFRLDTLLGLKAGWDSYGAAPPRSEAVKTAFDLLMVLSHPSTPAPQVVPTVSGGVQFEWHQRGIDLEVEVHSAFRYAVFFEDLETGEVQEEELTANLAPLQDWVERLSPR